MKRILGALLAICLLLSAAAAETVLDPGADRGITINKADVNPVIEGVSPVTGRTLADLEYIDDFAGQAITTRYMPMLVQIDNANGGIGLRAPWGARYADVVYEVPIYKTGDTRMSFLFSDYIPSAVGPLRSARIFHAWLREEWDCGFIYYGQQEYETTSVPKYFEQSGTTQKGILFSGIVGVSKPWKQYFGVKKDAGFTLMPPHDKTCNAAAVSTLIPDDYTAANHTWLFTDEVPEGGDEAVIVHVTWGNKEFNSSLEWNDADGCYERYMYPFTEENLYVDFDTKTPITFNNIIVQFTDMDWVKVDAPKPTVLGTGNADYFMGGRHYSGVWQREDLASRTVFYGEDGNEIQLQRGRTLIVVMDGKTANRSVSYE